MNREQKSWCERYQNHTGFEPIIRRDEFDSGAISFYEFARSNLSWFNNWAQEQVQMLEQIPDDGEESHD